jgi:hypothetical protein
VQITKPNGQVVTKQEVITVNNHHGFLKNLKIKYGLTAIVTSLSLLTFISLAVLIYVFVRPRPVALVKLGNELEELENETHINSVLQGLRRFTRKMHGHNTNLNQEPVAHKYNAHLPLTKASTPGTIVTPNIKDDAPESHKQ